MPENHYYYFVAGLADLVFDSGKNLKEMPEFMEELKNHLHPHDYNLVSIIFLPNDNRNLISYLENKTEEWDNLGTYSYVAFEEQDRINSSILKEKNILPDYMVQTMTDFTASEEGIDKQTLRKRLTAGYIDIALASGNRFLEKWIKFDTDIKNIFIFLNSKSLDLDPADHLVGNDLFKGELLDLFKSGKDFPAIFENEYASSIFKIATENEFLERERKIDLARWEYIDTINVFEYFTVSHILGYLLKYSIVLRWSILEHETGQILLKKFIEETESIILSGNNEAGGN
jgi:hypothetical protein